MAFKIQIYEFHNIVITMSNKISYFHFNNDSSINNSHVDRNVDSDFKLVVEICDGSEWDGIR